MTSRSAVATVAAGLVASVAVYRAACHWRARKNKMCSRLKGVSVQIMFSCGLDPPSQETFKYAYTCALLPFVLGIPSKQVQLLMAPDFVGSFRNSTGTARDSCNDMGEGQTSVLPHSYHDYFNEIYQRAEDVTKQTDFGTPSILIVSGHGFGNRDGGYLKFQGKTISFSRISPGSILTVLDVCSAAFAVASLTDQMPPDIKNFRTKHKKALFAKNQLPIVCDYANTIFQFRLGYEGQHLTQRQVTSMDYDERGFKGMSLEIGEAVLVSLMSAIRSYLTCTRETPLPLDTLFCEEYGRLRGEFLLNNLDDPPRPYSNLGGLQALLEEGVFPVRMDAFDCLLLDRKDERFLTSERMQFDITGQDGDFVDSVIDYIVQEVCRWYEDDPDGSNDGASSTNVFDREWTTILTYLGQFAPRLKTLQLDLQNGHLVRSSDGVPIGVWASPYGEKVSECRANVEKMLSRYKGLNDGDDDSSDTGDA